MSKLDRALFVVVVMIIFGLGLLIAVSLQHQQRVYGQAIDRMLGFQDARSAAIAINYARALDFATAKTAALILGFLMCMVGCLYVLRTAQAAMSMSAGGAALGQLSFKTTQPGLAVAGMGVVIIALVLFAQSTITTDAGTSSGGAPIGAASLAQSTVETPPELSIDFAPGNATVPVSALDAIDRAASFLARNPDYELQLSATGDAGGPPEENAALAERRQEAVKAQIQSRERQMYRIVSSSQGEERPTAASGRGRVKLSFVRNR
jgi:outer membrane protein OmpA-like peptidoglycan-associated protein